MIDSKSPTIYYFKSIQRREVRLVVKIPILLSAALSILSYYFKPENTISYLISVTPTISSIFIGFLSVILIASISSGPIFDRMNNDVYDSNGGHQSIFNLFFTGIFFNIILEVSLLLLSLAIGSINSSINLPTPLYPIEIFFVVAFLISSSLLLLNNLDRIYQITTFIKK